MWEHYKKTFKSMQIMIAAIAVTILISTHSVLTAAVFFLMMQIGSAVGGVWAMRIKNKFRAVGWFPPRSS